MSELLKNRVLGRDGKGVLSMNLVPSSEAATAVGLESNVCKASWTRSHFHKANELKDTLKNLKISP